MNEKHKVCQPFLYFNFFLRGAFIDDAACPKRKWSFMNFPVVPDAFKD